MKVLITRFLTVYPYRFNKYSSKTRNSFCCKEFNKDKIPDNEVLPGGNETQYTYHTIVEISDDVWFIKDYFFKELAECLEGVIDNKAYDISSYQEFANEIASDMIDALRHKSVKPLKLS